ncbi:MULTISPECIES: BTAD domain-containing putative transcriptional regulator [unclassified Saccharothrix]|uniref:BTAD domain-containing putative transcriptional regulator n=1 Tax=unclassified Saccharothrix TaxID=2593673 RepID=UPI00307ECA7B
MTTILPRPLDVELPRLRLVQRLARRWECPVTVVEAGAGFGKTTMLVQAVRGNLLEPRGVDVWVNCSPAHESAEALAEALLEALAGALPGVASVAVSGVVSGAELGVASGALPGVGSGALPGVSPGVRLGRGGVRSVVDAVVGMAPLDVCLVLDDVHEVPSGSPGAVLLGELVRELPATAHVVLCGRQVPELPLARREAAGEVVRVGAEELLFTDGELRALGRRLGGDPALVGALRGWPALVRLAFAAGPAAPWRYAWEEVLGRLDPGQRRVLAALAALHTATEDEVVEVGGVRGVDGLIPAVPLVGVLDDGRYRAHELWAEALARNIPAEEARELHRRAAAVLAARGDLARAGVLAWRGGDWELLAELSVELVNTTLSALPAVLAERWLGWVPAGVREEPAFLLLRAAVLHAADFTDSRIDPLLDRAWEGLRHTAVLGQAVITAHSRADLGRLAELARRGSELSGAPTPIALVLRHSVAATVAEVGGDPEAALAEIERAPVVDVPRPVQLATVRFHYHCLNMCGRAGEAAELADRALAGVDGALALAGAGADEHLRLNGPIARWFDGDPVDLPRLRGAPVGGTARDSFVSAAFQAVVASCCGDVEEWCEFPCGDPADHDNPRDAVLALAARCALAVGRGEEAVAREAFAEHLARWPVTDRFHERHLRRFLALGYVLAEPLREVWDRVELGPAHEKARAVARAVVSARAGDLRGAGRLPVEHFLCFLPLPWSVELAARLAGVGELGLGRWLADTLGAVVHGELGRVPGGGAGRLLAAVPAPPAVRTGVEVLGALRVTRDGVEVEAPELRRLRVRQLLGALVLRPVMTREQVFALCWPDLGVTEAARNLRVTLTYLRRLLEPDRARGAAGFHLRAEGDSLRLVRSPWLEVDLWAFEAVEEEVRAAREAGDLDRAKDLLAAGVELWRGDPLPDLGCVAELGLEADRLRGQHVRNLLGLGELCLVSGEPVRAGYLAGRALALDPFSPRGHRLVLAAALKTRDPGRVVAARREVLAALAQVGAPPDAATALLLRQRVG